VEMNDSDCGRVENQDNVLMCSFLTCIHIYLYTYTDTDSDAVVKSINFSPNDGPTDGQLTGWRPIGPHDFI